MDRLALRHGLELEEPPSTEEPPAPADQIARKLAPEPAGNHLGREVESCCFLHLRFHDSPGACRDDEVVEHRREVRCRRARVGAIARWMDSLTRGPADSARVVRTH